MRAFAVSLIALLAPVALGQVEAGLVAHWELEGNGDDSVGSHNGVVMGNPAVVGGRFGNALMFDGSDDYVDVPNHPALDPPDQMTVTAWFKPESINARWPAIVKNRSQSGEGYTVELASLDQAVGFEIGIRPGLGAGSGMLPVRVETWYFVAGLYEYDGNESTITMYLGEYPNPLMSVSATYPEPKWQQGSSGSLGIGYDPSNPDDPDRFFHGIIDDCTF